MGRCARSGRRVSSRVRGRPSRYVCRRTVVGWGGRRVGRDRMAGAAGGLAGMAERSAGGLGGTAEGAVGSSARHAPALDDVPGSVMRPSAQGTGTADVSGGGRRDSGASPDSLSSLGAQADAGCRVVSGLGGGGAAVLGGRGRRSGTADYDWFDRPHRPPRLPVSRPYGVPVGWRAGPAGGAGPGGGVHAGSRFPDPRGTWVRLINGGGPADDPFRASNAADCALAVLSTWHGEPAAAAPRRPEYDRIGRPLLTGEAGGAARIERWVGQRFQYVGAGAARVPDGGAAAAGGGARGRRRSSWCAGRAAGHTRGTRSTPMAR